MSMGFSSKNTGVGCHSLRQRIFPTQGNHLTQQFQCRVYIQKGQRHRSERYMCPHVQRRAVYNSKMRTPPKCPSADEWITTWGVCVYTHTYIHTHTHIYDTILLSHRKE